MDKKITALRIKVQKISDVEFIGLAFSVEGPLLKTSSAFTTKELAYESIRNAVLELREFSLLEVVNG